jgi:hypothetical protein
LRGRIEKLNESILVRWKELLADLKRSGEEILRQFE